MAASKRKRLLDKPLFRIFVGLLLLAGIFFTAIGYTDTAINFCGGGYLAGSNSSYLSESFDRSVAGFLILSSIKSGLAVLEGSEIGVGFNLEVGDLVQSIYDYVDVAWKTALAGSTILLLTQLFLETLYDLDHWLLLFTLVVALLFVGVTWKISPRAAVSRILRETILFASVLTLTAYLILPLSIMGAAYLSDRITRPIVAEARQGFESLEARLSPQALNERLFPEANADESMWSILDLKEKLGRSKDAVFEMAEELKTMTADFAVWTIKIIAGYLFDCLVFPLAFFVVVYILSKNLVYYLMGNRRRQAFQEDMETLLDCYFSRSNT